MKSIPAGALDRKECFMAGNRLRLTFNEHGFSVWDVREGRWVIDAFFLDLNGRPVHIPTFQVSNQVRRLTEHDWEKPEFELLYPKTREEHQAASPLTEVYVHKYLGCLCTVEERPGLREEIYALEDDVEGGYGLATIGELFSDNPSVWDYLGRL